MTQIVEAIYENGILRPHEAIHLGEHEKVRLVIENLSPPSLEKAEIEIADNPLRGFRFSLGIPDFSENFNDYRFGKCKP